MTPFPRRLTVLTVAAFIITVPAAAHAKTHRFPPAAEVTVTLDLRGTFSGKSLARFSQNRVIAIRSRSRRIQLRTRGTGSRHVAVPRGRFVRARLVLSTSRGRATLTAAGRTATIRGRFAPEDAVVVRGGRNVRRVRVKTKRVMAGDVRRRGIVDGSPVAAAEPVAASTSGSDAPLPTSGSDASLSALTPLRSLVSPWFAPDSIWNARLAEYAPLDPNSDAFVTELRRLAAPRTEGGYGSSIMTTKFGVPIYTVPADQPTVRVTLDQSSSPLLQAAFGSVPLPPNAIPAAGTDGNLAVWQPATNTMWEFWRLSKQTDGWHATWGGRKFGVTTDPGYYRDVRDSTGAFVERAHWGTTAGKFPLVAGVMTIAELERGVIPHALNFALPEARSGVWSWPAQSTDGTIDSPKAIPMGARFRLDPKLDVAALNLPPVVAAMARAAKRYGMIVVNTSGGVGFRAEDPTQYGENPYPALFGGISSPLLMRKFPWSRLQMLPLDLRYRVQP